MLQGDVNNWVIILDIIVVFVFFVMVLKNVGSMHVTGLFKFMVWVFVIWFIVAVLGLSTAESIFRTVVSYMLLAVIIIFPDEFKKMLNNYGRKGFLINKDNLIDESGRKELSKAVMNLSRRREGALIVIARKSNLQDDIDRGVLLGDVKIKSEMIEMLFKLDSEYNKGAVIIRDNLIVSANSKLSVARRDDLIRAGAGNRHLAALGVTYESDCIAIVVNDRTGKITISSPMGGVLDYDFEIDTREMNIRDGIDEIDLERMLEERLKGKEIKEVRKEKDTVKSDKKDSKTKKRKKTREEREKEIRENRRKRKEERRRKKLERKKKREDKKKGKVKVKEDEVKEEESISRGFGGYDV